MRKLKKVLSTLCLVTLLTLAVAPATAVYADTGPQGGSASGTPHPPPPPPPPPNQPGDGFGWIICWLFS